ncbi:outer membrane beta-barrel protein [Pedobacter sp. P351]|uniref:outer membrane beta-barrel protein n=1 Tax=Pedobacter superstes TaxID=3133441 RepID=UPI0030A06AC4
MNKYHPHKIALILILTINGLTLYGQERKTTFGAKVGLNKSDVDATDANGGNSGYVGTELYAGFFADTKLTSKISMGSELLFSFTDNYHLIELPVNLKYNLINNWNVLLGPKLDYIVDANGIDYRFKKWGLSAEVGSQYKINRLFFAELRYARSLTPQINSDFFDFYNGKRNTLRLGLGVNFSKAQPRADKLGPMRLRVGLSTAAATTSGYDVVGGADLRIQKNFSSSIAGTLSAGYNHYSLRNGVEETNIAYFPLKLGVKVFPLNRYYLSSEAGIAVGTKSEVYTYPFIYAAGLGMETKKGFDVSLRYEKMTGRIHDYLNEIKRPGQIALRVEYGLNLNSKKTKSIVSKAPDELTGKYRKSLFFEGLGNGLGLTGNFDIRLKPDRNDGFGVSAGAGMAGNSEFTLPVGVNYIVGKRRSGIEMGLGLTPMINLRRNGYNESAFRVATLLNMGYRFQSHNGLMLRASGSAVYLNRSIFVPFPGLAIGYSFK